MSCYTKIRMGLQGILKHLQSDSQMNVNFDNLRAVFVSFFARLDN
ncbi:hypothetical protein ACYE2N_07240 [Flavobacterium sp. MAHUQ-51]